MYKKESHITCNEFFFFLYHIYQGVAETISRRGRVTHDMCDMSQVMCVTCHTRSHGDDFGKSAHRKESHMCQTYLVMSRMRDLWHVTQEVMETISKRGHVTYGDDEWIMSYMWTSYSTHRKESCCTTAVSHGNDFRRSASAQRMHHVWHVSRHVTHHITRHVTCLTSRDMSYVTWHVLRHMSRDIYHVTSCHTSRGMSHVIAGRVGVNYECTVRQMWTRGVSHRKECYRTEQSEMAIISEEVRVI